MPVNWSLQHHCHCLVSAQFGDIRGGWLCVLNGLSTIIIIMIDLLHKTKSGGEESSNILTKKTLIAEKINPL